MSSSPSSTLIRSPPTLKDISKQVDFYIERPFSQAQGRIAYHRGRVAVASVCGVYVFTLDSTLDQLGEIALPPKDAPLQTVLASAERDSPWPNLRLRKLWFGKTLSTEVVPCLELAGTKLYLSVFHFSHWEDRGDNMWCYDFASPPSFV